jgi:hypothetical protein
MNEQRAKGMGQRDLKGNKERRSWEGRKLGRSEDKKLKAECSKGAFGCWRSASFEVGGRKGLTSSSPQSTN